MNSVTVSGMDRILINRSIQGRLSKYTDQMEIVPKDEWEAVHRPPNLAEVWQSKLFICQVYDYPEKPRRLSINRTSVKNASLEWEENITWDELMEVKRQCGYGEINCVEVFPPDSEIVNIANIRHLWVFDVPFSLMSGKGVL